MTPTPESTEMQGNRIVYDMPEAIYHADPCPEPSLSAGVAKVLLNESPRHAWYAHPRLNPDHEPVNKTAFDIGKAAHSLILNDPKKFAVIEADDWRTKDAKEKRDAAYAAGNIPLLQYQWKDVQAMAKAAESQLIEHECRDAFVGGKSEVTMIWQEDNGIWCRIRIDHISESLKNFYDMKTTAESANPEYAARLIFNNGYDVTSAFYKRGIRKVMEIYDPNYRFVIQEKAAPFLLSVCALDPMAEAIADRKIEAAIALWGRCLKNNDWPGYPQRIAYVAMPGYLETAWLAREERESA